MVRAGKSVRETAHELDISESCLHSWLKQDRVDHGERPGLSSTEHADLVAAKRGSGSWKPSWRSCVRRRRSTRS
ncbi:hypothetical protein [Amycolatopsis vastitatis]|uniref:hypothetical protein n=1 Tax=Amycolatopsis vastitatis TaxID=1905142 RepID=UPI0034DDF793